jgi:hypothetical protein
MADDRTRIRRDPGEWVTGEEPMTAPQAAYLRTLCRDAGEAFEEGLTKAEASRRIDALRTRTGRAPATGARTADSGGRTAEDVLAAHLRRRAAGEIEEDLRENFDPDVIVVASDGAHRGPDGVRYLAMRLREDVPDPRFTFDTVELHHDLALVSWQASGGGRSARGVDSYVIRDGRIVAQTTWVERQ